MQTNIKQEASQKDTRASARSASGGPQGMAVMPPAYGMDVIDRGLTAAPGWMLQTQLAINEPGDEYEQEADEVADMVMRMPEPQLQRKCARDGTPGPDGECEACEQKRPDIQRKALNSGIVGVAPPIVNEVLRSPGQPLDLATRTFMESRFSRNFSEVHVHTGSLAEQSARDVNAHAYTVGKDIVFGSDRYAPRTNDGRQLIAHELTHVVQQQGDIAASGTRLARQPAKPDAGPVKAGYEIEAITKELKYQTNYGELKLTASIKLAPTVIGAGSSSEPIRSSTTYTSKDKPGAREQGIKQSFSYNDLKDLDPLSGLRITDLSIGVEGELSGSEVTASGNFSFKIVTSTFSAPATAKVILIKAKEGEGIKVGGVEFKIAPFSFSIKNIKLLVEYKASFVVDLKKVGAEVLEKIAKDQLKKEAAKQGVKVLTRKAGETVLKRLGPIATAFGIGWDIGTLLNQFTVAPEVALAVDEAILGDLNERYHKADTLGKMWLISKNSPKIVAALIASGVVGAVSGIGDLVLFKLLGLDKLPDFAESLKVFNDILSRIPTLDAWGDLLLSNSILLGIKLNPKYSQISDPSLARLAKLIFDMIRPLYKVKDGYEKLRAIHIYDIYELPESDLDKIVALIVNKKLDYGGRFDLSRRDGIASTFLDFNLEETLAFMDSYKLISYKIQFSNELGMDAIDPRLVDEVFR